MFTFQQAAQIEYRYLGVFNIFNMIRFQSDKIVQIMDCIYNNE